MPKIQYLQFTIHLTDAARVAELQGTTDPGSNQAVGAIIRAPEAAADEYDAPIIYKPNPFVAPCITSPWLWEVSNPSFQSYPTNVATFTRKSGGWFGISWLFGTTTRYYWRGIFAYVPLTTESPIQGESQVAMARRRWIDGFEMADMGDGGSGNGATEVSRGASRHVNGFGLKMSQWVTTYRDHVPNETIGGANPRPLWERFYVRVRRLGATSCRLHMVTGASAPASGVRLSIIASGQILIENVDGGGTTYPIATVDGFTLDEWTRIDLVYRFHDAAGDGPYYSLYRNGALLFESSTAWGSIGLGQSQLINYSRIGNNPTASHGFEVDVDDWIGADWPLVGSGAGIYPGLDWNNGSRVVAVQVDHASATNGTWAGVNFNSLKARPVSSVVLPLTFTSSTSGDRLSYVTDADRSIDRVKNAIGIAALRVAKAGLRAGVADGQLGYKFAGEAEVLEAIVEQAVWAWDGVGYFPSGLVEPKTELADLEIVHVKAASVDLATLTSLQATAELLGQFYDEDKNPEADAGDETLAPEPRMALIHNAPYPRTPWAQGGPPPPFCAVEIVGGTYVGNGTVIEIPIAVPVHFLFIRNVTSGTQPPQMWWSTMNAGHSAGDQGYQITCPVEVLVDPNFPEPVAEDDQSMRVLVRITGTSINYNQAGQTYQYIAFCDPGMRFNLSDAVFAFRFNDYVQAMGYDGWTPEFLMLHGEDATASSTNGLFFKGLGHDVQKLSPADAAETATGLSMAENELIIRSGLVTALANVHSASYMAWRRHDGNNDPGEAKVLWLSTYTGDGSASRTINFSPASGVRPLFAIVVPHNGFAYFRDPSDTGTNSRRIDLGTVVANGITAGGIDSISVGSSLNSNGIVYDVFVLPGSATAGNNGWSINGDFYPVEPDSPIGGEDTPWGEEPDEPSETPGVEPEPEPTPEPGDEEYDFSDDCIDPSTKIINKALSYIGISKQVGNILTEASAEAVTARLHFSDDVNATLRDYPWAFATRYAVLTLVRGPATNITTVQTWLSTAQYVVGDTVDRLGTIYYCVANHSNHAPPNATYWTTTPTTEANGDWTYAYRPPAHMIFARRIVNPDGSKRDYDPDPPRFRVGSDANGGLIYTDAEDPELEYTFRLDCVAESGDAIFRKALTWRHAASLAPALARDEKKIASCWVMYERTLGEARTRDANEQQQSPEGDVDWITGRE